MPLPHLSTALHGPILDLENRINTAKPQIEHWLRSKWREYKIPFYCSVDLRNSGFKLAPVDTNLFPGGFYRVHTGRSVDENLNAPGMHFVPLPFEPDCLLPDSSSRQNLMPLRFYAYSVVARLAFLAAALELQPAAD